jgi:hypothetical protein
MPHIINWAAAHLNRWIFGAAATVEPAAAQALVTVTTQDRLPVESIGIVTAQDGLPIESAGRVEAPTGSFVLGGGAPPLLWWPLPERREPEPAGPVYRGSGGLRFGGAATTSFRPHSPRPRARIKRPDFDRVRAVASPPRGTIVARIEPSRPVPVAIRESDDDEILLVLGSLR